MKEWNSAEAREKGAELRRTKTIEKLWAVLDVLCNAAERNIFVVLPENPSEQIPYLKKEIEKCLDNI
tara:strand:- start:159 stop:359 length:201 start_codon:yes stop_codon:yes gene_type:complete